MAAVLTRRTGLSTAGQPATGAFSSGHVLPQVRAPPPGLSILFSDGKPSSSGCALSRLGPLRPGEAAPQLNGLHLRRRVLSLLDRSGHIRSPGQRLSPPSRCGGGGSGIVQTRESSGRAMLQLVHCSDEKPTQADRTAWVARTAEAVSGVSRSGSLPAITGSERRTRRSTGAARQAVGVTDQMQNILRNMLLGPIEQNGTFNLRLHNPLRSQAR
jgi:hypothetical protein